jgi:hypothetical protein
MLRQRNPRGTGRFGQSCLVRAPSSGLAGLAQQGARGQRLAHPSRCGDQQLTELVQRAGAGGHRAGPGQMQLPDRLHHPGGVLRDGRALTGQHLPGGGLGIDRVILSPPRPGMSVRPVDLNHPHPGGAQKASQPSAIATGALDSHGPHQAKTAQPFQQPPIPALRGGE